MLGIVLPGSSIAGTDAGPIPAMKMVHAIKVVIVVDEDIVPTAPTAAPTPASTPHRAHEDADTEGNRHACSVVTGRRIVDGGIRVHGGTINDCRVVTRDVDHLGI